MDRIFAPWRSTYVTSATREPGCVMCRAMETKDDDGSLVVHAGAHCFVVMNLYPYNAGHAMVAPRRHMNLGKSAGAGVADHMHLHLVPRWNGDGNFMTVIGETRVLSEEPAQGARRLRPYFT
jgi:ATP adenylyltransferase